ncbi:MAG: HIT family protein, partial [Candidatus Sungbacteria bacterium]|nr:HIT family protein [Candidatus Sungbacteria bacterium]
METVTQNTCLFCSFFAEKSHILLETSHFFVTFDNFPVNRGHSLIIPKRHCSDVFILNTDEWANLPIAIEKTKSVLDQEFKPNGYNIGANCGKAAGQTIFH